MTSIAQIKLGQKLRTYLIKILAFCRPSRKPFKSLDCSTPSLAFAKVDTPTNKRLKNRDFLKKLVQISSKLKLWRHSFKILAFRSKSRYDFEDADNSIFVKNYLLTNKRP